MHKSICQYVFYIYCYTVGFHDVRRIASCNDTYGCINVKCPYLLSYRKENKNFTQKSKADVVFGCCGYSAIAAHVLPKKCGSLRTCMS